MRALFPRTRKGTGGSITDKENLIRPATKLSEDNREVCKMDDTVK